MARHSFGGRSGGQDKTLILVVLLLLISVAIIGIIYLKGADGKQTESVASAPTAEPEYVQQEMVKVLVPLKEIAAGIQLQPSMFDQQSRLAMSVDERTVKDFKAITNMFSRTVLIAGSPLLEDHITNIRPTSSVSVKIPSGFRAVTIRVNATSSVEGWAKPGSKVDVHWILMINNQSTLKTIVQNAKVLSAERQISTNATPSAPVPSTITLLVSASDAQKILLAETCQGTLSLSLRGDSDPKTSKTSSGISTGDLGGGSKRPAQRPPNSAGFVIIDNQKWIVGMDGRMTPLGE